MLPLSKYDIYIFDCDGVILDSNQLKISAMKQALLSVTNDPDTIENCINYFKNNFGKSRFHHVEYFLSNLISHPLYEKASWKEKILESYSEQCVSLYLSSNITDNFVTFLNSLNGQFYVASGSEQEELRSTFKSKGLDHFFNNIFGSPTSKSDIIKNILSNEESSNAVMFGDSVSDFEAAKDNDIDFIFYAPYSNVQDTMISLSKIEGFPIIYDYSQVIV